MTVFYTGKGDRGKSVMGGTKIAKDDILFDVLGSFDEVNSIIGWCKPEAVHKKKISDIANILTMIQEGVFMAQAEIGAIGMKRKPTVKVTNSKTRELEDLIDAIDRKIPPIKNFIIPGATEFSARLDMARAAARRAERLLVMYTRKYTVSPELTQYMNRLSSILFALARLVNYRLKKREQNPRYR